MATTSPAALTDLTVGDRVAIKRNLDHPANMLKAPRDDRDITQKYIADPAKAAAVDLGTAIVTELRTDFYGKKLVRLGNGFWYDLADGYQDGAKATIIELI